MRFSLKATEKVKPHGEIQGPASWPDNQDRGAKQLNSILNSACNLLNGHKRKSVLVTVSSLTVVLFTNLIKRNDIMG